MQNPETHPAHDDLTSLVDKSRLVSDLGHELRTVLGGVIGINELLLASELSPHQRQLSQTIEQSSKALLHVLNDIVDLSRLEGSKAKSDHSPSDIRKLIAEASEQLEYLRKSKKVKLEFSWHNVPTLVLADSARIRQIFLILLRQMLKCSERARLEVRVSGQDTGDTQEQLRFEFHGPIGDYDEAFLSTLTEPVRVERKLDSQWLSLFLCHRLVSHLGGSCGASFADGAGTLWVSLPVVKIAAPA